MYICVFSFVFYGIFACWPAVVAVRPFCLKVGVISRFPAPGDANTAIFRGMIVIIRLCGVVFAGADNQWLVWLWVRRRKIEPFAPKIRDGDQVSFGQPAIANSLYASYSKMAPMCCFATPYARVMPIRAGDELRFRTHSRPPRIRAKHKYASAQQQWEIMKACFGGPKGSQNMSE
jgi:hypothetical protein